jgi:hypothetical protein
LFLAICGYYNDTSGRLHEVVLGFEPLYDTHSGKNIGKELVRVLQRHGVADRLYTITTDNASNNTSVSRYAAEFCPNHMKGQHLPCLAHVLQQTLQDFVSTVKTNPTNDSDVKTWSDDIALSLHTYFIVSAVL